MRKDKDMFEDLDVTFTHSIEPNNVFDSEVIKKLDEFAEHYYNGDYIIDRNAFQVPCKTEGRKASLGNLLTMTLANYLISRGNKDPKQLCRDAENLITWLTQIRGAGLITENPSLLSKLKTVEEENKQLKETKDLLEIEVSELKAENEELHRVLNNFEYRTTAEE
jgi:hypothetical protein